MKITILILSFLSFALVGCDRETLEGLNIKINADINSDYKNNNEELKTDSQSASSTNNDNSETPSSDSTNDSSNSKIVTNNSVSDPDVPMPFRTIADCSPSGITMKTNETYYASRGQVKSINSKDVQELKEWKEMYGKFEAECNK